MQFDQLKCFLEVAETKSFSKAAERLFMTQQAISKNVKKLEEDLGCELFFRTKNGVVLTLSGESVLEFAQQYFESEKALVEKLGSIQQSLIPKNIVAELIIGSTSPIISSILPSIIGRIENKGNVSTFMKLHDISNADTLLEAVYNKSIQFGLITVHEEVLQSKLALYDELDMFVIAQDKLIAVMNRNYFDAEANYSDIRLYSEGKPLTAYNILPNSDLTHVLDGKILSYSSDESFHYNMMKELGAVTIMPEIVYQQKFSSKRHVSLQIYANQIIPIVHAAIYYKDPNYSMDSFLGMFQRELYVK